MSSKSTIKLSSGPTLSYVLSTPSPSSSSTTPAPHKLALIAHPLGRLGGCKEDHVVQSLARLLVSEGWTVCTYDARGAGESTGMGSFS